MNTVFISKAFIDLTVFFVPCAYNEIGDYPPENYNDYHLYDKYIDTLQYNIEEFNDEHYARLAFEYILTSPKIGFEDYDNYGYGEDGKAKSIIMYVYNKLWPDHKLPDTPSPVELIDMDQYEWRKKRDKLNPDN